METGVYVGSGPDRTFIPQTTFNAGDTVVVRARVTDKQSDSPVSNATVGIIIEGPQITTLNSDPSDAGGWADASWKTSTTNSKGFGGTRNGLYTANVTSITATGYRWDFITTQVTFTIQ
jgi:hypothetical protein